MHRLSIIFACLALAASRQPSRFAAEATPSGKVVLRVEAPPTSPTGIVDRARRAVFDAYVRTHPDVELVNSGGLALEGTDSGLLAIAGGVSPDVFSAYFPSHAYQYRAGFICPLDEYLDTWEGASKVPPQLWPVATGSDGKRYGAIYNWPTVYLIYRRTSSRRPGSTRTSRRRTGTSSSSTPSA